MDSERQRAPSSWLDSVELVERDPEIVGPLPHEAIVREERVRELADILTRAAGGALAGDEVAQASEVGGLLIERGAHARRAVAGDHHGLGIARAANVAKRV